MLIQPMIVSGALLAFSAGSPSAITPTPAPALEAPARATDAQGDVSRKLVADRAEAIVTLKFVIKSSGPGGEEEAQREAPGVMIEEGGLVLTSNLLMGGVPEAMKRRARSRNTAKDIKVLVGDDTEGVEAKIIARDSELDLAWVQITKADKKYKSVDFSKGATVEMGDPVLLIERLGRYHDRIPVVDDSRVRAVLSKPRKLYFVRGDAQDSWGLPVFDTKGEVIGVAALQLPSAEELEADQEDPKPVWRSVVLPADAVVKATATAKENAKSGKPVDEEPPAPAPEGDKPGDKPAGDKQPAEPK